MRLHTLEICAFGPFADSVSIDFDDLSGAGLFLLSGPTGAGKSSILDAVCFALYGDVPGDRSSAKRLRCDQAAPGVSPRVSLEATLAGRRFRLVRSPAWERPKRRGTGTTGQQASVTIAEQLDGAWEVLSSRLDETGHLVTSLLGMNLPQFTQVALLPQGRFQTFLRAKSDERHRLLQQLFRTGRFEQVESWLRDRRLMLKHSSDQHHDRVSDLVSRISESTDSPIPGGWDLHDLALEAADGSVGSWVDDLVEQIDQAHVQARRAAQEATRLENDRRAALDAARRRAEWHDRLTAATLERDRLEQGAEAHRGDLRRLDDARRAVAVQPLARLLTSAQEGRLRAEKHAATSLALAHREIGEPVGSDVLERQATVSAEAAVRVRAAQPKATRLEKLATRAEQRRRERGSLGSALGGLRSEHTRIEGTLEGLRAAVEAASAAGAHEQAQRGAVDRAQGRVEAHTLAADLSLELAAARGELSTARRVVLDLQEALMQLQQARIDGMAAELASALAVGDSCPVCGSAEHPHKAGGRPGSPDAESERPVRSELADAKVAELAYDGNVRSLETRLAVSIDRTGDVTREEAQRALADAQADLAATSTSSAALSDRQEELTAIEARLTQVDDDIAELLRQHETAAETLTEVCAEHALLQRDLDDLLDGAPDLETLLENHQMLERVARAALSGEADAVAARKRETEVVEQLDAAAAEAGFDTVDAAVAAVLPVAEVDGLNAGTREHDQRLQAARSQLEEPGATEVLAGSCPDLETLEVDHTDALGRSRAAHADGSRCAGRRDRLRGLADSLHGGLAAWAPVRADFDLTRGLSSFAEGKAADNRLQMRLSAYVLAYRLSQVVAAANLRLARMSDQRYSLEHTGHRGAGETRGGLSLVVRDDWSGESRDPATLSGGETFVVSLALALGLADVIAGETGGADLETLFVDEGFGSLDAETLDDVMDTLDSLRDGGRVVGVVSHVAEMRDRIPTQLVVTKSRTGSTTAVRH